MLISAIAQRFRARQGARCRMLAAASIALLGCLHPAAAHPHVFVVATAIVNIENGAITSISHTWTFDEFYTAMATEGLAKNKDGGYGRAELAELAKVNVDGLKEFQYFTFPTLGKTELKVGDPKEGEYYLEHKDSVLSLHFTVPLMKPVLLDAKGFAFLITDPSYFIAFELSEKDPPKLNPTAPPNCKLTVGAPKPETPEEKKLGGAFAEQMAPANLGFGEPAKSIMVSCAP